MMGKRDIVWKTPDITADGLKMFACIVMFIRTIGIVVIEKGMIHLESYTQSSLNEAMAQDSHLMTLAGLGSVFQAVNNLLQLGFPAEVFTQSLVFALDLIALLRLGITDIAVQIQYSLIQCSHTLGKAECSGGFALMCSCTGNCNCLQAIATHLDIASKNINCLIYAERKLG